jgi:hypothetical protein
MLENGKVFKMENSNKKEEKKDQAQSISSNQESITFTGNDDYLSRMDKLKSDTMNKLDNIVVLGLDQNLSKEEEIQDKETLNKQLFEKDQLIEDLKKKLAEYEQSEKNEISKEEKIKEFDKENENLKESIANLESEKNELKSKYDAQKKHIKRLGDELSNLRRVKGIKNENQESSTLNQEVVQDTNPSNDFDFANFPTTSIIGLFIFSLMTFIS